MNVALKEARRVELEEMIARVALADREAFDALYDATSAKLHAVCLSLLKDRPEAEETLQEVYVRIWQNAARYASNGLSPMTWLITIARNRSIDRLRARKSRPATAPAEAADAVPSAEPGATPDLDAIAATVKGALARPETKTVLTDCHRPVQYHIYKNPVPHGNFRQSRQTLISLCKMLSTLHSHYR